MQNNSDFIPAPAAADPAGSGVAATPGALSPSVNVEVNGPGIGTTELIIAGAVILVVAVVLYFVRSGIRNALISARATSDSASFAATAWYAFLLIFTALVVLGTVAGLFKINAFLIATAAVTLAGLAFCAVVTANARKTRN